MKYALIIFSAFILFSCNSDDDINSPENPSESSLIVSSYKETINRPAVNENESFKELTVGDILQNKFTNYTIESYINDELMDSNNHKHYEYKNNQLINFYPQSEADLETKQQLFYDENQSLTGIYWEKTDRYYRIIHKDDNIDYFEWLSGPFDDSNTEVSIRFILKFDENDNVVRAGIDRDLDDIMDFENKFTYDENNNIVQLEMHNGKTISPSYSTIKNTKSFVLDNSYGKRVRRLFCSQVYANSVDFESIIGLEHSTNLRTDQVSSALSLETNETGFYTKYQKEHYENSTYTIEFFFE
ncbi:hypothetical protein [Mesonia aquimarina]|uniref:hypothetical protein n=1 Tax=Mesonia aquimarina TaxID=1504967 RepID=UPI000EF569D9|nr:hypothetical protein [Mesonia aquimarina]